MRAKEIVQALRKAGFVMQKDGRKHEVWVKGSERVTLSHGTGVPIWAAAKMRSLLRRHGQLP
jgi:hypothetical protein